MKTGGVAFWPVPYSKDQRTLTEQSFTQIKQSAFISCEIESSYVVNTASTI